MEKKKILWFRKLSCGHTRPTKFPFLNADYDKPKVDEKCYCIKCRENVKIVKVTGKVQE